MSKTSRKRHKPEQIVKKLRDAEAMLNSDILDLVRVHPRYGYRRFQPSFTSLAGR